MNTKTITESKPVQIAKKGIPTKDAAWMIGGATFGLIFGVMAMSALLAGAPSLGNYIPLLPKPAQ